MCYRINSFLGGFIFGWRDTIKIVSKFGLVNEFPLFHCDRFEGPIDGWMLQLETISVKAIERLFDSERKQFLQIQKANYH